MSLFLRPDSPFWWMTLEGHGHEVNGRHRPRKESTGIRHAAASSKVRKARQAQAEEVYHARMVQLARQRVGLPVDSGVTFDAWSRWYEEHHTDTHASAARERVILAHLRAYFGAMVLSEIRPARWQEYQTARLASVGENTVGRELAVMKTILNTAVGEHLEVNPLASVKRQTARLPPKRTITKDEDARLLEQLRDEEIRDLYILGVGTLLRQQNLISLRRRQYHSDRLVVDTKTGPHAVSLAGPTPLQTRAATTLARRLKAHKDYLFPTWQARFARDRDGANAKFLQGFRRACTRADIPWGLQAHGVVWHTATRASGATRMIRDYGVDVRTVQVIGNWRSLDQMAEYLGVDLHVAAAAPSASRTPNGRQRSQIAKIGSR